MLPGDSITRSLAGPAREDRARADRAATVTQPSPRIADNFSNERGLRRVRRAVALSLASLAVLVGVRLSHLDGILRTIRIEGPSMAPALKGAHYALTCADCRFPFRCDAIAAPADGSAVCPNCGYKRNSLTRASLVEGDRVLVDRWPGVWQSMRRGQVVAARQRGSKDALVTKRLVALPGERLAIRDGDLYANDRLVRKTYAEWRALRVLVHDNDFIPAQTRGLPPRWQASHNQTFWRVEKSGRLSFEPRAESERAPDWLTFQPWRCTAHGPRTEVVAIRDNDGYNQGTNRGSLNSVRDVGLSCTLAAEPETRFVLAAVDGQQRFEAAFDFPREEVRLTLGGEVLATGRLRSGSAARPIDVELSLCDQQVFIVVRGFTVIRRPYRRPSTDRGEVNHPLAIGDIDGRLELSRLRVWRDIHYLEPLGTGRPWQADAALTAKSYGLLGDNPPVSIDSRQWQPPGIPRQDLLGCVHLLSGDANGRE
jgi:signal peptidase I